jgi:CubicO group peptidase (beta-lactamase class C family)
MKFTFPAMIVMMLIAAMSAPANAAQHELRSKAGAASRAPCAAPVPATEQAIEKHMLSAGIVGLGAAVIVDGEVVWRKGFGFADKVTGRPFTPDTIIGVASISKTFLGVAMMQAVQDGRLSLDADVNAYLPFKIMNPHRPNAVITLRRLATHTSGISDRSSVYLETYHYGRPRSESLGHFLKSYLAPGGQTYSADNFLDANPGEQREYSNIGAALVSLSRGRLERRSITTRASVSSSPWG